jgi:pimeloyl-ACP methyl ester carboxylesterase
MTVDGVGVFYREAGPKNAPAIVLLHGFPSSSREFDTLIPLLAKWAKAELIRALSPFAIL